MDFMAEDTWAHQNLDKTTDSSLNLWDRLEKDYREWLEVVHCMSPERFNEMSLADRLQLRGNYYNADDAKDESARRTLIDLRGRKEKRKRTRMIENPKLMDSPIAAAEAWLAQYAPHSQSGASFPQRTVSSKQTLSYTWDKLDKDYQNWLNSSQGITRQVFNDMTTAERLQLRESFSNSGSISSVLSLWGKLDQDYREWLKSSHGITPESFNVMTPAERLQLRTSYYNTENTSTSALLWDELDVDYQRWLKSSQGITLQKFNEMRPKDRLNLRTRYCIADSASSSLWDKLDTCYRKWIESSHDLSPQEFNAVSTANRLRLRTSYYNAIDNNDTDEDKSEQILNDLRARREESRKRRKDGKSKRPRRSRIAVL